MQVDFTPQEIVACRQLLETALKTIGRNAVPAYMALDQKLEAAQTPPPERADDAEK